MAANYYDSALLGFQGRVTKGLASHEVREKDTAVLPYALDNLQFLMDPKDITTIKKSVQRPVYGYQFNRIATTNGTGMTTMPTGTLGSSVQLPLTFVTFSETFATYNVSGLDNVFQFGEIFDNQATQAMRNIRTRVREWLTSNIYSNRTTSGTTSLVNTSFNADTDAFEIAAQNPYAAMTSIMRQNSYGASAFDAFFDPQGYTGYEFSTSQGTMNATNLQWQFAKTPTAPAAGGYFDNLYEDLNLGSTTALPEGYNKGYAMVLPKKSFAMVPWMPANYYAPGFSKSFDQYVGGYGTIGDNVYNQITYQIFGWNNQSDTSGSNGYAQSQTQNWQIGLTLAFFPAYLSDGSSPIFGFAITS